VSLSIVDKLDIFDGTIGDQNKLLFGQNKLPVPNNKIYTSSSASILVRMTSSWTGSGILAPTNAVAAGFTLVYICSTTSAPPAPGILTDSGGDGDYSNNEETNTLISCPFGMYVAVKFALLDIDGTYPACRTDYIVLSENGEAIYKGCGSTPPEGTITTTTSNHLLVSFVSDLSVVRSGYRLEYRCIYRESGVLYDR
jgi:hypothetical protein